MPATEHRPTSRVLDIMQLLAQTNDGYSLTEIANHIQVPKSTITPIIHTLYKRNFITLHKKTGKYIVSSNAFIVGSAFLRNMNILSLIKDEMKNLVSITSETCQFGVLVDGDVLYLAKEDSPEPIRLVSFAGKRLPAYCSAIGKALLSNSSLPDLKKLYPNGLTAFTNNTITDFNVLNAAIEKVKNDGIAYDFEEVSNNLNCFAVPLQHSGKIIAALSINIPNFRLNSNKKKQIEECLLQEKQKLEKLFLDLNVDNTTFFT